MTEQDITVVVTESEPQGIAVVVTPSDDEPTRVEVSGVELIADGLTDAQLRAAPVVVHLDETIQGQSDAITDAQLRAAPVPVQVMNPDPATDVSGLATAAGQDTAHLDQLALLGRLAAGLDVTVANSGDGLTDAQLRAAPVVVHLDEAIQGQSDGLTDAQLRAEPVEVHVANQTPATDVSGLATAAGQTVNHDDLAEILTQLAATWSALVGQSDGVYTKISEQTDVLYGKLDEQNNLLTNVGLTDPETGARLSITQSLALIQAAIEAQVNPGAVVNTLMSEGDRAALDALGISLEVVRSVLVSTYDPDSNINDKLSSIQQIALHDSGNLESLGFGIGGVQTEVALVRNRLDEPLNVIGAITVAPLKITGDEGPSPLSAHAVFTGMTYRADFSSPGFFFTVQVNTDQPGTVVIEHSSDGVDWLNASPITDYLPDTTAGGTTLTVRCTRSRYRVRQVNGDTPQGRNVVTSALTGV